MSYLMNEQKIAPGADNIAGLTRWGDLQPELFIHFSGWLQVQWYRAEAERLSGAKRTTFIGRPWVEYTFFIMTIEEYAYLKDVILDGELSGEVTIREYNTGTQEYGNYTGTMYLPDLGERWSRTEFENVVVPVMYLKPVS